MTVRPEAAAAFRRLHQGPDILLLANAWDAGSARLIESLGAKAIATTSAGVAWALGYPDGDALPQAALRGAVAAIARVVAVPLTVDIEGGYAGEPAAVGESVAAVVEVFLAVLLTVCLLAGLRMAVRVVRARAPPRRRA